jgi:hypothetical protein
MALVRADYNFVIFYAAGSENLPVLAQAPATRYTDRRRLDLFSPHFPGESTMDPKENQWAMALHLSQLLHFVVVVPFAGFIAPILIWQLKKGEFPSLDAHGKIVVNWLISALIYGIVSALLLVIFIGIPLLVVLGILGVAFPIIGGIKASSGEVWKYPLSITFLK